MNGTPRDAAPIRGDSAHTLERPPEVAALVVPQRRAASPERSAVARRAAVLKALSNPTRLEITEALQSGELCVNELRDLVGMDVSTVSKHLSILRAAGVLNSEKRGLNVYYGLACECFGEFLRCVDVVCAGTGVAAVRRTVCC